MIWGMYSEYERIQAGEPADPAVAPEGPAPAAA
jgi:hypothetical protein